MGAEQVNIQPSQNRNHLMPGVPGIPKGKPPGVIVDRSVVQSVVSAQIAQADPNAALRELESTAPIAQDVDYSTMFGGGSVPVQATAEPPRGPGRPGRKPKAKPEAANLMPIQGPNRHGEEPDPPPNTRRQYEQEQRELEGPRPEITDIFTGMAGGEMPRTGFVGLQPVPVAPQGNTKPLEQVIVKHELPNLADAYKFTEQITAYVGRHGNGSQSITFAQGQILYDAELIEELLAGGVTCLVPVAMAQDFIQCPQCGHQFPPQARPRPVDQVPPQYYMNSRPQTR